VSAGEADVCVEGGGEAAQERDGGLGAAFLDALDVVAGHGGADGEFGDGQAEGGADVVKGLPNARASRIAMRSGSSAASWGRAQRVW
jgi:hypothetical protein